jgi:2-methylisocitrate lyase-like PEP mutase family enzyme
MNRTSQLKSLILGKDILVMPGVYDALSARVAQECGHKAVFLGGFSATGALLAEPDTSQLSLTELAALVARVCEATDLPVFVDADTGFGNVTNVRRTVRMLERAGASALFIEDQVFPKRCGHTAGKAVVPVAEMVAKIRAAADARVDADMVIMARTDAIAVNGLEDAIARANLYREAGADLLFVEAPRTVDDMRRVLREVKGPHLANMVDFGHSPELAASELHAIGYAAAIWPVSAILAVTHALREVMSGLAATGTTKHLHDRMVSFDGFTELMGLPALRAREADQIELADNIVSSGGMSGASEARAMEFLKKIYD